VVDLVVDSVVVKEAVEKAGARCIACSLKDKTRSLLEK